MKRSWITFLFCVLVLVFSPSLSHAGKIAIKMSYGRSHAGRLTERTIIPDGHDPFLIFGQKRFSNSGQDVMVDVFYSLTTNLSFSLGFGHTTQTFPGSPVSYTLDSPTDFYDVLPEITFESNPVLASALFRIPLTPSLRLIATAGGGLYFARFHGQANWMILPVLQHSQKLSGSANDFGFHAGGGVDIDMNDVFSLNIQALYRSVKFGPVEVKSVQSDGGIGQIFTESGEPLFPALDYRIEEVSLSGLVIRTGLKFRF